MEAVATAALAVAQTDVSAGRGAYTAVLVAVISLLGTLLVAVITTVGGARLQRRNAALEESIAARSNEADERIKHLEHEHDVARFELEVSERAKAEEESRDAVARRYREPLLMAAIELYGRLRNIVGDDFLGAFLVRGRPHEKRYAENHTLYQVAQYFCWVEIVRREVQFLAPGNEAQQQELEARLQTVSAAFSSDDLRRVMLHRLKNLPGACEVLMDRMTADARLRGEPTFRLFRGEQRALGEVLTVPLGAAQSAEWGCMGYAQFMEALSRPATAAWFDSLREDIAELSTNLHDRGSRLVVIQAALVELIDALDPQNTRSPHNDREVVALPQR
ncbi:hypothetical protein [Ornithinimicrobium pekingense]|uniref:Uncharacterized protein n=1 Tax=Ornithinimicrobium pekingense TaxID=384677 RepID=A0ABQ2F5J4_9MICO|nr:hypothetical protein [Ornithinimicrobium pekingense]GGK64147.1 hypothetical protein GCM10011509_10710 [Ornithinimicrobium pekingense]